MGLLRAVLKGFSVYYLLLLPILYAAHTIGPAQLGYIGAMLVAGILVGALTVTYRLHRYSKATLLWASLTLLFGATLLLFWFHHILVLIIAYILIGLASGVGVSTVDAVSASLSTRGKRYGSQAKIAMLTDISRILYPLIIGVVYVAAGFKGLIVFGLLAILAFGVLMALLIRSNLIAELPHEVADPGESAKAIRRNKSFLYIVGLEFMDSLASSQLVVFLPALLIFKGFTIEHALFYQSAIFIGYLSGRWLIGRIAQQRNGYAALGLAESGMVVAIILILLAPANAILYALCFLLGVFSRGTSPVIKAMAFDQLESTQIRRGTALHVIGGDSGSALGQLGFGLLLAWLGVKAPFIAAAACAAIVAVACVGRFQPRPSVETT